MFGLLSKALIKEYKDYNDPLVRRAYGKLAGGLGIILNIFLFVGKYVAGFICGSVSMMADAMNNLSDAGSSVVTLLGFQLAGKKPDPEHPFGHGRFEYISGLIVSGLIMYMGIELLKTSVEKIFHPEALEVQPVTFIVLIASIGVKVYMSMYNRSYGKKIDSSAMKATAIDSLSDCIATSVVLLSMILYYFTKINIDGISGLVVAIFVLMAGYSAAKETLSPLLGEAPDPEFVRSVEELVLSHTDVTGIHDMVVHDYGPGRKMISLHAEVSGKEDIYVLHDLMDVIELELREKFQCEAVLHMDPIETDNEKVMGLRKDVEKLVKEIDEQLSIHDFRMVDGPTHTNLIFDVVLPQGYARSDAEVSKEIQERIATKWQNYFAVIKVDKRYT